METATTTTIESSHRIAAYRVFEAETTGTRRATSAARAALNESATQVEAAGLDADAILNNAYSDWRAGRPAV